MHPSRRPTRATGRRLAVAFAGALALLTSACAATNPPTVPPGNKLVIGIGPELNVAEDMRLTDEAPIGMLTSWYNGHGDLKFMAPWQSADVPAAYASGKALHIIVWAHGTEKEFSTGYGTACGRKYPLTNGFLDDMEALAKIFAGPKSGPPLYVTLFTEFQTYPCSDSAWNPNATTNNYLKALKDRYVETRSIFRQYAPNSRVSLGWGGWQNRWDEPSIGGGRSMFGYFDDVMRNSDFQSFQAMESDTNTGDIQTMTKTLGAYGPVMVAHYKPDNRSQATFDSDVREVFNDAFLAGVKHDGLFAFSFMDDKNMGTEGSYQPVKDAVLDYGAPP